MDKRQKDIQVLEMYHCSIFGRVGILRGILRGPLKGWAGEGSS